MDHTHDCECFFASCAACMRDAGLVQDAPGRWVWVTEDPAPTESPQRELALV